MAVGLGKHLFKSHCLIQKRWPHFSPLYLDSLSQTLSLKSIKFWHPGCDTDTVSATFEWRLLQTMSSTQNRDEVDTCPCLLYTHQVCFKTQQLWCNRNGYQSNNVPRTNPRKPRRDYLKASWDFFHKEHPKGKRFYSRSIRQLNGTQAILFHGHRRGWTSHCLWQLCGSSASVLVSQST